jgi:SAM-dependent methyltransferase
VAENRDVLDARPGGEGGVPETLVSRGWSDFLSSLEEGELEAVESDGLDAAWPERTPESLRSLVRRAREVCTMPALVPAAARAAALRPGETPRKRAQIDAFGALVLSVAASAARVVDVGSGHGHLTRAIAERTGRPVIGLERDAALAGRARAMSRGGGPSFAVTDVLRDGLAPLPGDCFVGLHACGELGDAMVTSVARAPGTSLALVGCCLQKRRELSRLPLCPVPGMEEKLELSRRLLGLSNLTARDEGVEASRSENLAGRERRLALHRLLADRWGPMRLGAEMDGLNRRVARLELSALVARAFARRGAPAPSARAIDEAARWAREAHARARRLSVPRSLLARVLEVYVLLDRAMHLGRGGFAVRIGTAFPGDVSARNLALVAS